MCQDWEQKLALVTQVERKEGGARRQILQEK